MSELLGPPPIEPLPDVAWMRIERELWSALDTAPAPARREPVRSRAWLAIPALAAAAVLLVWIAPWHASAPAAPAAVAPAPVAPRDSEPPARLVTGPAPSALSFGDAHVTLDAESAVTLTRDAAAPSAMLERGAAWFAIAPRAGRAPFFVVADDVIVRVVGTRFRVARTADATSVEVEHGVVEVQYRGTTVIVGERQQWTSRDPAQVGARTAQPVTVEPPPIATAPPRAKPIRAVVDDRARYEQLAALEPRDPAGALRGYLQLAERQGPWAEVALFAAGRLAADRRDPRATKLLTTYLRRFPAGANVDDARELIAHLKGDSR